MTQKEFHVKRADAFFKLLGEVRDDLMTFSYNCQKNLVNPKVPDQAAYYSRQIYTYNFTIVQGHNHCHLTTENVFI